MNDNNLDSKNNNQVTENIKIDNELSICDNSNNNVNSNENNFSNNKNKILSELTSVWQKARQNLASINSRLFSSEQKKQNSNSNNFIKNNLNDGQNVSQHASQ